MTVTSLRNEVQIPDDLRDTGRRAAIRLEPTGVLPGRVALEGRLGWTLSERGLRDISAGGLSLWLGRLKPARVPLDEHVTVQLLLSTRKVALQGKVVHLSKGTGPLARWWLGVEFKRTGERYGTGSKALFGYLRRLKRAGERAA